MLKKFPLQDGWLDRLISEGNYSEAAELLFSMQLKHWDLMRENYEGLKSIKVKSFLFDGFKVKVQFNPARIKSTSADVSEEAVTNRSCFLCAENLPSKQKGILLKNEYLVLCNPYPIFPRHFTIASIEHRAQSIQKNIKDFLELTKLLSDKFTLIYNGPQCGASAPNHLHFQAGTKLMIPVEDEIYQLKNDKGKILFDDGNNSLSLINDGLRTIVFIESPEADWLTDTFDKFFDCYSKLSLSVTEPMMNLLCRYDEEFGFSFIIFLRSKHRPKKFFEEGEGKILVSPAAVDLGGLLVAPREQDFEKVDKEVISMIFKEVSLNIESFAELEERIKNE